MVEFLRKKDNRRFIYLFAVFLVSIIIGIMTWTKSQPIEDGVKVVSGSPITYYIKVSYDGTDYYGIQSSDTQIAQIKSNVISVEDTIPKGLKFERFMTTIDGTIGAVSRDGNNACNGYVINDTNDTNGGEWNEDKTEYVYRGLHYNTNTGKVTFKVKDLQAGCDLSVGVMTFTPSSPDDPNTSIVERRMDFYNTAIGEEKNNFKYSNTVHAYIGDVTKMYPVTYEYVDNIPSNAPELPKTRKYAQNTTVVLETHPKLDGYKFMGWYGENITDNTFIMPNHPVTLHGLFISDGHKVKYVIDGDVPEGYTIPSQENHSVGTEITVDKTTTEELIDGYSFSGWSASNVTINDGMFTMPDEDVILTGTFTPVNKKIKYYFVGNDLPSEVNNYLPEQKTVRVSTSVILDEVSDMLDGYAFKGWNHESTFEMPNEDLNIIGNIEKQLKQLDLTITSRIIDQKDGYKAGDEINFEITVTNNSNVDIKELMINVVEKNAIINKSDNYKNKSSRYVLKENFKANEVLVLTGTYTVGEDEDGKLPITSRIAGAVADDYELPYGNHESVVYFDVDREQGIVKAGNTMSNALPVIIIIAIIVILAGVGIIIYAKNKR